MGLPAAKQNDQVVGIDIHIVMVPSISGQIPTPLPHPFSGRLDQQLSTDVKIDGMFAATVGSVATNRPPHIPTPPGVAFQVPPAQPRDRHHGQRHGEDQRQAGGARGRSRR